MKEAMIQWVRERIMTRDPHARGRLTPREIDVLAAFWTQGGTYADVASRLHMSVRTLNTHLDHARRRLGVHSTLEAVVLAGKLGYLD